MTRAQLPDRDNDIARRMLGQHARSIGPVGTFGSRATGKARPASDLDLVVYGPIGERAIDRLRSEFEDSSMSISVDIVAYDRIENEALKQHIDAVMQPLFAPDQLRQPV